MPIRRCQKLVTTRLYAWHRPPRRKRGKIKEKAILLISTEAPDEGPFEVEPFEEKHSEAKASLVEEIEEFELIHGVPSNKLKVGVGLVLDIKQQLVHLL